MKRPALLIAVAAIAVGLGGCTPSSAADRPEVVVTTNILGDVVKNVAGETATVTTLMKPNADPHSFEISVREAARMDRADLLVTNGLGLEEGLQQHIDRTSDSGVATLVAGDVIDVLPYTSDDAAGSPDPHFWTDPARMIEVVDALEAALSDIAGIDAAQLRDNAQAYRGALGELDHEMSAKFAAIPSKNRALVTNHHVFGYLADRFDFRLVGAVIPGGTTLAAPSAADLRGLTQAIDEAGVRTIFAESSQPDRLIQVLATEADLEIEVVELYTESLTAAGEGADTYLSMMRANTQRISDGLDP